MNENSDPLLFTGLAALIIGVVSLPMGALGWGLIFWGSILAFLSIIFELKE